MRIGMFTDRYLPLTDGVTYTIVEFRQELEKLGHEVYIFAPSPTLVGYKESDKQVIRFPAVKGLFFEDYLTTFFFPPQVAHQIDRLHLDIIHYHTPGQIGLLGAYYALHYNIPLITTYHTDLYEYVKHYPRVLPGGIALSMITPLITGGGMQDFRTSLKLMRPEKNVDKWNQKIVQLGMTLLHNRCDMVIAPSKKMQRQQLRWGVKVPIAILPSGIDKIPSSEAGMAEIRHAYNLSLSDKIVLSVGRMSTEKNIELLIKSFDSIAKQVADSKLLLVGTGDDIKYFKKIASKSLYHDRIIFTGNVPRSKLGDIYAVSRIFAFPSVADTQGMVSNEAAWAGLPIVAIDSQVTDIIENGKNGYFAKNNIKDFAAKVVSLLDNPDKWRKFSRYSLKVAPRFSASTQTAKLLELYEETINIHETKQ